MDQDPAGHHVYSFDQSPSAEAERLRKEARGTPAGVKCDQLLHRARQMESKARMQAWPNPPGLKAPT